MEKGWIIIGVNAIKNRVNGGIAYEIRFSEIKTKEFAITYVDPNNMNYSNWIEVLSNNAAGLEQVISNLKIKRKSIVDADSFPNIVYSGSIEEIIEAVNQFHNRPKNQYARLFE